ncbi:unnamed protein product [Arctogadus glacialis]
MEKWSMVLVFHVGALYNAAFCSPPMPVDVWFSSINLQNCLHWLPGEHTPPGTYFRVQYAIYGERWRVVPHCRDLELTRCDLTNQTQDLEQGYFAKVRAVDRTGPSKWKKTQKRFDPKTDTILGPPLVTLEMKGNSAIVNMKSPMRYQPDNSKPEMTMLEVYPQMAFNLSIRIADSKNLTQHIPFSSGRYVYRLLDYDTEYCFSARTRFNSMPIECQPSTWHCIKTPHDPFIGQLRSVVVGIVVPLCCICVLGVGAYFIHYLVWGKEEKWPQALEPKCHPFPPPTFTPEHLDPIHVSPYHPKPPPPPPPDSAYGPPSPIDYASQGWGVLPDLLCYALQGRGASPEPEPPWEDCQEAGGTDYGFVRGDPVGGGQEGSEDPREGLGHGGEGEGRGRGEEDEEEEDEDAGMIHLDPESGVFVLPETWAWAEGGLDGWLLGAGQPGSRGGEEEQEAGAEGGTGGVRLENVFVRQGSEEQRENTRAMELEMGTLLANWSVVVVDE